ncbi:MAG: hypothetical protein K6G90_10760 [Clostridia bacterium]|nr:hypothetical protein [Clostridia bacterium]
MSSDSTKFYRVTRQNRIESYRAVTDIFHYLARYYQPHYRRAERRAAGGGATDRSGVRLIGILPEDKKIPFMSVTGKGPDQSGKFMLAVSRVAKRITGEDVPLALNKL